MELVDWRELYAANRAVIEGRRPLGEDIPLRRTPARPGPRRLAAPQVPPPANEPGTWARLDYPDGRRERPVHVYTPPGLVAGEPAPLVVMLHGCTQTAATFAAGSLMNRAADRHGFVVAYPEQSRSDNQQGCWNWFAPAHQGRAGGEPRFIAGAARLVMGDAGRAYTRTRWTDTDGRLVHEYLEVEGLGHAWSGGARGGSYTDPRGPSAAEAIWAFFAAVSGAPGA